MRDLWMTNAGPVDEECETCGGRRLDLWKGLTNPGSAEEESGCGMDLRIQVDS